MEGARPLRFLTGGIVEDDVGGLPTSLGTDPELEIRFASRTGRPKRATKDLA